ncbi:carboxylesterase/lipase family protein [Dermatobacter hominis]|uniref:carboxylesterase/lipase family protein n=1 Tax=Dermatobacter hominis TaxID=2884263 RepID=UPI001D1135BE|nr:carboxylesterase/lipase family protein [Dermatobacter hominis]UDY35332.1 carboxylesterase/lipase family protein [Dermatobacter hominis]
MTATESAPAAHGDGDHVVVTTTHGALRGEWRGGVARFAGIPFAAPPVGDLRFRPPAPASPWEGERDATAFGAVSPQNPSMMDALFGGEAEPWDEDCLHLNVWTPDPAPADGAARPVMVWIHGGGFEMGSGSSPIYDGTRFAEDGVVFVSLNYRLGSLGFLDLSSVDPAESGSGNVGLLDQVAALEWVRDNIASFGGDPRDVTIFGESAGSMSVSLLLTVERAAGLFHRAIAQSGGLMAKQPEHATADTAEFLAAAGVETVAELRALPVEELLKAHAALSAARLADPQAVIERTGSPVAFLAFTPVADGVVVPSDPLGAVAAGSAAGVDLIVGTNLEEWKLFAMLTPAIDGDDGLRSRLALVTEDVDGAIAAYAEDHPGATTADLDCALLTDVVFRIPASELADAQAAHATVRQYRFDWRSTAWGGMLGAAHAIEIPFVFDMVSDHRIHVLIGPDAPAGLAAAVHDAWVSFAVDGAPTIAGLGEWPALPAPRAGDGRPVVVFDAETGVQDDPQGATRRFWTG